MDKTEFKNVIKDYANLDKLEKFIHMVHEMKKSIEKNIEIKFKEDLSLIQIEINKKLDGHELNTQLEQFATHEEVKNAEIDLETYDFDNKAKKLKKFVRKIVIKELDEDEFSDEFSSNDSSFHASEMEDEIDEGDVSFKLNQGGSKAYLKGEAEDKNSTASGSKEKDKDKERAKISRGESKNKRKAKKMKTKSTLEDKDLTELENKSIINNTNIGSALNHMGMNGFKSVDI